MTYQMKTLSCDPTGLPGLSEWLIRSHYENNYDGAVKRLSAITDQLAGIDPASTPVFVLNGLKREELIAANSMILHEIYFDSLGPSGRMGGVLQAAIERDFGSVEKIQRRTKDGKSLYVVSVAANGAEQRLLVADDGRLIVSRPAGDEDEDDD